MQRPSSPGSRYALALLALVSLMVLKAETCEDHGLLNNPGFDLWCGDHLCSWQLDEGSVERVPTWHRRDFGVALVGERARISQLVVGERPDCIEFRLLADLDPGVQVLLEMDFQDDGTAEYSHPIPDADFKPLVYSIPTPSWFERVRFVLRKQGAGRAVLAQISAYDRGQCGPERLPMGDRPAGAGCDGDDECASGICADPAAPGDASWLGTVCGGCRTDTDCGPDEVCGAAETAPVRPQVGAPRACVVLGSREAGQPCMEAAECAGPACEALNISSEGSGLRWACVGCWSDDNCGQGEVCGLGTTAEGWAARDCVEVGSDADGSPCAVDAECAGGACVVLPARNEVDPARRVCGECHPEQGCDADTTCGVELGADAALTSACGAPGRHALGERCLAEAECASGTCCAGVCSECCAGQGCSAGARCDRNSDAEQYAGEAHDGFGAALWYVSLPHQCDPGLGRRAAGEGCLTDADCGSGSCSGQGELAVCHEDGRRCEHDPGLCAKAGQICIGVGELAGVCD